MLLWLWNGQFFFKNVAVTNVLEGYPSSSLATGLPEAILLIKLTFVEGVLRPPGAESIRVGEANEPAAGPT